MIIFIRPEIINTETVFKEITERQEDLFRAQAVTEEFDQGLELVKSPNDK